MRAGVRPALAAAVLVLALALAGCKTAPAPAPMIGPGADAPWPDQVAALEKLDHYTLAGRVAVAAADQGFSGSLRYAQQAARSDLAIDGPLGMGGLRAVLDGSAVNITTARGENFDGNAAREELERRLGFALPLEHLRWWLLGIPVPGETLAQPPQADLTAQTAGFDQLGWRVTVNSRAPAMGFSLPQRLTIEREGARLKLIVDRWQP